MKPIISITLFILITFSILQGWLIAAGVAVVLFSLRHSALMLIPLAIMIDGYFGNFYAVPFLSLAAVWWYLVADYFRPKVVNLRSINK